MFQRLFSGIKILLIFVVSCSLHGMESDNGSNGNSDIHRLSIKTADGNSVVVEKGVMRSLYKGSLSTNGNSVGVGEKYQDQIKVIENLFACLQEEEILSDNNNDNISFHNGAMGALVPLLDGSTTGRANQENSGQGNAVGNYTCDHPGCNKIFKGTIHLQIHKLTHPRHETYVRHMGRLVSILGSSVVHSKKQKPTHKEKKSYQDDYQGNVTFEDSYVFKSRKNITGEIEERAYKCEYPGCGMAFTQSAILKNHKNIHGKERRKRHKASLVYQKNNNNSNAINNGEGVGLSIVDRENGTGTSDRDETEANNELHCDKCSKTE